MQLSETPEHPDPCKCANSAGGGPLAATAAATQRPGIEDPPEGRSTNADRGGNKQQP